DKRSGDVVGQVPEAQRGAAEVLKATVDRLGRAVGRAAVVEEREDVRSAARDRAAEADQLGQILRNAAGEPRDHGLEDLLPARRVLVSVGGDGALVDVPGNLDGEVVGALVEYVLELRELMLFQQAEPRPEQAPATVKRITLPASMPESLLLNTLAGLIKRVAEELDDVEWVHHRDRVGDRFAGGGLEIGRASCRESGKGRSGAGEGAEEG